MSTCSKDVTTEQRESQITISKERSNDKSKTQCPDGKEGNSSPLGGNDAVVTERDVEESKTVHGNQRQVKGGG